METNDVALQCPWCGKLQMGEWTFQVSDFRATDIPMSANVSNGRNHTYTQIRTVDMPQANAGWDFTNYVKNNIYGIYTVFLHANCHADTCLSCKYMTNTNHVCFEWAFHIATLAQLYTFSLTDVPLHTTHFLTLVSMPCRRTNFWLDSVWSCSSIFPRYLLVDRTVWHISRFLPAICKDS